MTRYRKIIIPICLLILFLCQMLPAFPHASVYFDSHPSSDYLWFDINPLNNTVPILHSSVEKQSFEKILARNPDGNAGTSVISKANDIEKPVQKMLPDMRDVIKEAIPQYFNGSKYKTNLLS